MKTEHGFAIHSWHIPSSSGDFCSLSIERIGTLSIGVYPLTSDNLRQLAGEMLAVAMQIDSANADTLRHKAAVEVLEMAA